MLWFEQGLERWGRLLFLMLFSPATQTCCSEGEDVLEFFDKEF
jgi:hypothetical protein